MSELVEVGAGLWHIEQHHYSFGLHVRVRMVIVKLANGTLWLHSPVEIDDELSAELSALGPVSVIVSPNLGHTKWAAATKALCADATLWGPPGCRERHPRIPWDHVLDETPPWVDDVLPIPLAGTPKINEVVFLHPATRTLLCTDLVINVDDEPSWLTRQLYRSIGVFRRPGAASLWRRRTVDRAAAWGSYERVLATDFDRVILAHGEPVESGAKTWLTEAVGWAAPAA